MSELNQIPERLNNEYSFTPEKRADSAGNPPVSPSAAPPVPQGVRRVGTFTMGLSLIASGSVALICLFDPGFDIVTVLRFSPLVLILLGTEVLLSSVIFRNDRLKYDFWSGVVCFFLICMSVGAALLPPLWEQYGPGRERLRTELTHQAETLCYDALKGEPSIQSLDIDLDLAGGLSEYRDTSLESLSHTGRIFLHFTLAGDFTGEKQFAEKAHDILERLSILPFTPAHVSFSGAGKSSEQTRHYTLSLDGLFALRQDADSLAQMVGEDSEWSRIQEERQALEQERQELYAELDEQREALSRERERLFMELEEERGQIQAEIEQQRTELAVQSGT